jgi:pilus assembly protein CpaB
MNTRAFTLALIISAFAMFMVYTYVEDQKSKLIKDYGRPTSVVVASKNIKELELIDESKVTVTTVPNNFLAPGAFKTIKEIENTVATVPVLKGEQITKPRVTFPGVKTGLARQVSVGKRAIAIKVRDDNGVSKLIKPGDRVDVLSTIDYASGRTDMKKIKTVLQDVLVLSTGLQMSNSLPIIGYKTPNVIKKMNLSTITDFSTITLELNPFEAQKVLFLNNIGSGLILSLRNNNDKQKIHIRSTKLFDILGDDTQEAKIYFSEKYKKTR